MQVDRRGLDATLVERLDLDMACGQGFSDGSVRENHAGQTIV
jgi:hypothetical protein